MSENETDAPREDGLSRQAQGWYAMYRPPLKERLTRRLGYGPAGWPGDPVDATGYLADATWDWSTTTVGIRLGWRDRLRVLVRGKLEYRAANRMQIVDGTVVCQETTASLGFPW